MECYSAATTVRLVATDDGAGALLVDLTNDLYYSLNSTALAAWQILGTGGTLHEAAAALTTGFDVSADEALPLVTRFAAEALDASLLVETPNSAPVPSKCEGTDARRS